MSSHKSFHASVLFVIIAFICLGPVHQCSYIAKPFVSHILSLQTTGGAHQCGGAILSPRFALTAAHCFENRSSPAVWRVVAGDQDLSKHEGTEQVRQIKRIHVHPEYSGTPQWRNDIALVELDGTLNFKAGVVGPIEWKDKNWDNSRFNGEEATAYGWGMAESGNASTVLKEVELPILTNSACKRQYQKLNISRNITDTMLCAGIRGTGRDTCTADLGGPLVVGGVLVVGIRSFGEGCGMNHAVVYSRVNAFTDWIESSMDSKVPGWTSPVLSSSTAVSSSGTSSTWLVFE